MYYSGDGVRKDYAEAVRYLTPLVELGDTNANAILYDIFSLGGYGVKKNLEKAAEYNNLLPDQENETGITNTWLISLASVATAALGLVGYKMLPVARKPKKVAKKQSVF